MMTHALASTTLTERSHVPKCFRSLHTLLGFVLVLHVVNSIVVAVTIYSFFDLYVNSL